MPTEPAAPRSVSRAHGWLAVMLIAGLAGAMSSCGACGTSKQAGAPSAGSRRPSARVSGQAPSAPVRPDPGRLLADDLASAAITLDQATRYRVLRIFQPAAVPQQYRYAEAPKSGTWDLLQAARQFSRLSPETASELLPYLVRPADPRSIFHRRLNAQNPPPAAVRLSFEVTLNADTSYAREVYRTDNGYTIEIIGERGVADRVAKARQLVETHKIYEKFYGLLKRETRDYGDRTLVIHIFSALADVEDEAGRRFEPMGICFSDPWVREGGHPPGTSPAWIAISSRQAPDDFSLAVTIAHEMFHAFQFAFSTGEEKWLVEGSAVWAEDFIGHDWNDEQGQLDGGTFRPDRYRHNTLNETSAGTAYGMYLFFYYLTRVRSAGDAGVMRLMWQNCEAAKGSTLSSVKAAVGGEFADVFHDYGFLTLDEGDVNGKFPDTVGSYGGENPLMLSAIHGYRGLWHIDEEGRPVRRSALQVEPMAVSYVQMTNASAGPAAPAVLVDLSEFKDKRDAAIHAVIQYRDGRSETEDWSDLGQRVFCLALDSQNFESIHMAVSNAQEAGPPRPFALDVRLDPDVECAAAQMRLTTTETGEEGSHYSRRWADRKDDTISIKRWRQQWSFGLDLVPLRRNRASDASTVAGWLQGDVRERARALLLQPVEGQYDEHTGCTMYTFRVARVRLVSFDRTSSATSTESDNDVRGLVYYRKLTDEERWSPKGLGRETLKWLADESLKVRVYVDPESRQIRWVLPMGPIDAAATGTRSMKQEGRQRLPQWPYDTYEDLSRSDSHDLSATMGVAHVSSDDKALPLNPDWKARQGTATSAQGEGRLVRPLDRTSRADEGETTITKGLVTQTVKWSLRMAVPLR